MNIKSLKWPLIFAACLGLSQQSMAFTLQDAVIPSVRLQRVSGMVPSVDGESYYKLSSDGQKVMKVSFKTGEESVVFDSATARDCDITEWNGFELSADEGKVLLYTESEPIYRHSFRADYYVYEIRHNKLVKLSAKGGEEIATFSPDGRMVAYVKDNNIYIKKLDYDTEVAVTKDGEKNNVIYGVPDWVYQEEFGLLNSLAWSPDNLMLSFIRWDESQVPLYSMQMYQGACNPISDYALYPGSFDYKYPKAGDKNSVVSVVSYDVETRVLKTMNVPMEETDYIPRIAFGPTPDRLMVTKLNRHQNDMTIYAVNPRSAIAKSVYNEKAEAWFDEEAYGNTKFYDDFFVVTSERSGYAHLYQYSNSGSLMRQLTKGDWEVTDFYGYNPTNKTFYFQSTMTSPLDRTIAKVDAKGVIAPLTKGEGTYSATFSNNFNYYVQDFSDARTPDRYTVCATATGKSLRTIEKNDAYAAIYTASDVPVREFFTMESDGVKLNGYMIKPVDFNPSKKYPVIMSQYSGPGSQQVKNKWTMDWESYFATQGYIVACVDGRGTGFRGREFKNKVYLNLGKYETIDQIAAATHMASLPYVDSDRIGIWGWSFGGYESLMAASANGNPYRCAVAIAPVTDWRYYDTVYAERFMRTPQENENGYQNSAPINKVNDVNCRLLVMHGTADDNVHISNSYQYAAKMTEANKILDMMVFTNMNHSINGCDTRYPLYLRVLDFYNNNLKK